MKELKFTRPTTFLGRNGEFTSIGLDVIQLGNNVKIRPITSKNLIGRATINVPVDEISKLIKVLKKFKKANKK